MGPPKESSSASGFGGLKPPPNIFDKKEESKAQEAQ